MLHAVVCVLQSIMVGLKQVDDESAQLTSLTDLCEHLSISTEESLATFPVEQVVPLLVSGVACLVSTGNDMPGTSWSCSWEGCSRYHCICCGSRGCHYVAAGPDVSDAAGYFTN